MLAPVSRPGRAVAGTEATGAALARGIAPPSANSPLERRRFRLLMSSARNREAMLPPLSLVIVRARTYCALIKKSRGDGCETSPRARRTTKVRLPGGVNLKD